MMDTNVRSMDAQVENVRAMPATNVRNTMTKKSERMTMPISEEEWDRLKENEKYGMIASLMKRIDSLEKRVKLLEGD